MLRFALIILTGKIAGGITYYKLLIPYKIKMT